MAIDIWVLKGTKLITNTKKAKIKNMEFGLDSQKYNIKEKRELKGGGSKQASDPAPK